MNYEHKKALFNEMDEHLLFDDNPSKFLNKISNEAVFSEFPFHIILRLKTTDQNREHHPEGSVWNHTVMVVDEAAKHKDRSENPKAFMWAALLHDIGKPDTTRVKRGKVTSYDHDIVGADLTRQFLCEFDLDKSFIQSVTALVRWHMQILFVVNDMPFADLDSMSKEVNVNEIALLGLCDRLGRGKVNVKKEEENIRLFLAKAQKKGWNE